MKKAVEELNQSANRHAVVNILCKEQGITADGLGLVEAVKFIADGKERIHGMQLIMNADCDKHDTLINDYDREYLGGINK